MSAHSLAGSSMAVEGSGGGGREVSFATTSAVNPIAEAMKNFQEQLGGGERERGGERGGENQGFRSIVTANEGGIAGMDMHDAALYGQEEGDDLDRTHHEQLIARLQAQSPSP